MSGSKKRAAARLRRDRPMAAVVVGVRSICDFGSTAMRGRPGDHGIVSADRTAGTLIAANIAAVRRGRASTKQIVWCYCRDDAANSGTALPRRDRSFEVAFCHVVGCWRIFSPASQRKTLGKYRSYATSERRWARLLATGAKPSAAGIEARRFRLYQTADLKRMARRNRSWPSRPCIMHRRRWR